MNYSKIYDNLISIRQTSPASGYSENHHIIPSSLGGSDDPENLVRLTGREHYVAHLLLHRIHRLPATAYALWMMQCKSSNQERRPHIKSSRMYEWARKEFARFISTNNQLASKGANNSQFGTRWICNLTLKRSKKLPKAEVIPEGWITGRNLWTKLEKLERAAAKPKYVTTSEHREAISRACKGKEKSEDWRQKVSKPRGPRTKRSVP